MTVSLTGQEFIKRLSQLFPEASPQAPGDSVLVKSESVFDIVKYLKTNPELDFDFLNFITAVDYFDYFEVVYMFTSLKHNHSLTLKTRCYDRDKAAVPSIVSLYKGADYQEREIYDLMGVNFKGHPNLKRIFLWEGFEGYPLRKDYLR